MKTVVSVLFGIAIVIARAKFITPVADDFTWALTTAEALLTGNDPYAFEASAALVPYPLPVALFGLPLLKLPAGLASDVFFGISSALLLWGILASRRYARILLFLSWPYWDALLCGQWSPMIAATWCVPMLAPLMSLVKPQAALPIALARWRWRGGFLAAGVLTASLVMAPDWPVRWLSMTGDYEATYPFAAPLGFLLLISVLWIRKPRARLLFLASILPYRGTYDWLPLGMIPTTARQVLLFVLLSWVFPLLYVATGYENALIGVHLFCLLCLASSQYRRCSEGL